MSLAESPLRRRRVEAEGMEGSRSLHAALHAHSSEASLGTAARRYVSVPTDDEHELSPNLKKLFVQLQANVDLLERMFRRVSTFTQTEAHLAGAKGSVLFHTQRELLGEATRVAEAEVAFLSSKLRDLDERTTGLFASPEQKSNAMGWHTVYSMLAAVARVCNASAAAVFVLADAGERSGRRAVQHHPAALTLAAFVSASKLTPLDSGVLHADILELVEAVVQTQCSLNARAPQAARSSKSGFETILACPLVVPRSSGSLFGVVVMLDRVAPPRGAARMFSTEDESRLHNAAENISEIVSAFRLIELRSFIAPTTFENLWNVAVREEAVLRKLYHDPAARAYVYRDSGAMPISVRQTELQMGKQRSLISQHQTAIVCLQDECARLEAAVASRDSMVLCHEKEIEQLRQQLQHERLQTERSIRRAETMRIANEMLLRNSFVKPLDSAAGDGYPTPAILEETLPPRSLVGDLALSTASSPRKPAVALARVGPQSARRKQLLL